ncbi:MAG: phenylalanine--tRNA ligase subunit alpha [candidate division Zixibacteria bacterium 4484_93]|nr:MAG: phenylalanine--tRNA ligase subunit alpha [candidate division Zixibacteria bacterium 4484_93]
MPEDIQNVQKRFEELIKQVTTLTELDSLKVEYLGKKGIVTGLLKKIPTLPASERKSFGTAVNSLKSLCGRLIQEKRESILKSQETTDVDISLPGRKGYLGSRNPIITIIEEITHIFYSMGFEVIEGPDIETEYYNFDALNTPDYHPSRDIQDTFYLAMPGYLLRTQTSPVQIRTMETHPLPIRMISPGRCYRRDAIDPTHYICFHQVEGLYIDRNVTMAMLKGVLSVFARRLLGKQTQIRFRPHFFPFTEPSVEYDITCTICGGKGCRVCKNTGWLEISGAGMVHPKVLEISGIDPKKFRGYAFGMGVERLAMIKYQIDDIRHFYNNDIRFLSQFRGR